MGIVFRALTGKQTIPKVGGKPGVPKSEPFSRIASNEEERMGQREARILSRHIRTPYGSEWRY